MVSSLRSERRESDPTAMLGLVILVVLAELLAIAIGVAFGLLIG